jgi:tetratricopeptide (TPR) repeat protein
VTDRRARPRRTAWEPSAGSPISGRVPGKEWRAIRIAPALGLVLALGACATAPSAPAPAEAPRAAEPATPAAPPPAAPPVPPPSPRQELAGQHREQARKLEAEGQLRRARDEWKIALTIAPDDAVARDGLRALEGRIEREVTARIQEGRAALSRGVTAEARRKFLAALALDPTSKAAFHALQEEVREPEYIAHTVRPGDTLASLAQRYYGDRARSEVIAETNQLTPNARLAAGTRLRIPEIPGVPFVHAEARPPEARTAAVPQPEPTRPGAPAPPVVETPEVNPLLQEARESLEKGDLVAALGDVDRYLASDPRSREGLDLKKAVLYRHGKNQFAQRKYGDSYRTLTQLAKLQPDYEDSANLLRQARTRLVDQHYSDGIRLYREEKLKEAIGEWRAVLELDPQHAGAKRNIEQAERLLRGLEERRKR